MRSSARFRRGDRKCDGVTHYSVSDNAGDVNGDGLDDLIIRARGGDSAGSSDDALGGEEPPHSQFDRGGDSAGSSDDAGKSYLVFGKTDGTAINRP